MKLMFEEQTANFEVEEYFNEATGITSKKYKINGVFSTIGEKNKNGRVYPKAIWESQVYKYQEELANGSSNCLMELNHPSRSSVDMMEAVAKIEKLYIKDKYVMGEAFLLNNPKANQLKSLIDAGITMAVSSRGVGSVGRDNIVESFKLITYDIIPDQGQSDYNAKMRGIVEGVLQDKEYAITESGNIEEVQVCSSSVCHLYEKQDVSNALEERISQFIFEISSTGKTLSKSKDGKNGKFKINISLYKGFVSFNEIDRQFEGDYNTIGIKYFEDSTEALKIYNQLDFSTPYSQVLKYLDKP